MKYLFRTLIALAYLASAVTAQAGFVINSFWSLPASISFVGCTESTDVGPAVTFTTHATGTAGNRDTIVTVGAADGTTNFSVSSMTVGGVAAAEIVDSANTGSFVQSAIYIINNPTGTTSTIVVTFSEAITESVICVYAAYDVVSETAHETASQFQSSSNNIVLSLNVPSNGIGVGTCGNDDPTEAATWAGMTEDAETVAGNYEASSAKTTTEGTPLTVGCDWTGVVDAIGVSASFR